MIGRRLGAAVIALAFPVAVLGLGVRAAMSRAFLAFEYGRPGFPADQFGFSTDDRMLYGSYGLDYILNDAGPRYLGDLVFRSGEPVFTAGEVSHMTDVKHVLGTGLDVSLWLGVAAVVVALLMRSWRHVAAGLRWGVALTVLGIAAMAVVAATAWERFFAWVHSLFFASGTWTFSVNDTLIRVYPEQFWRDAALLIAVVVAACCALALIASRRAPRSGLRSRRARRSSGA